MVRMVFEFTRLLLVLWIDDHVLLLVFLVYNLINLCSIYHIAYYVLYIYVHMLGISEAAIAR